MNIKSKFSWIACCSFLFDHLLKRFEFTYLSMVSALDRCRTNWEKGQLKEQYFVVKLC